MKPEVCVLSEAVHLVDVPKDGRGMEGWAKDGWDEDGKERSRLECGGRGGDGQEERRWPG